MINLNDDSVITACSKCIPTPAVEATKVWPLMAKDDKLLCSNPACGHDWTNWEQKA